MVVAAGWMRQQQQDASNDGGNRMEKRNGNPKCELVWLFIYVLRIGSIFGISVGRDGVENWWAKISFPRTTLYLLNGPFSPSSSA
jgi:hypothetical protein